MKISIITVVYNNPMVAGAIDSILSQDLSDELELIVIDGGSTDSTLETLEARRKQLAVLISEPDQGIYDAMNKGLHLATGDIVGTLNADDFYPTSRILPRVMKAFQDNAIQAAYGDVVFVDSKDMTKVQRRWNSCPYHPGMFRKGWMPPHPSFFVRREVYEKYGYFDPRYTIGADFDLMARLLGTHNLPSLYIPETLVHMRSGGTSNGKIVNILKANLECYRACKANGLDPTPLFIPRKIGSKILQLF